MLCALHFLAFKIVSKDVRAPRGRTDGQNGRPEAKRWMSVIKWPPNVFKENCVDFCPVAYQGVYGSIHGTNLHKLSSCASVLGPTHARRCGSYGAKKGLEAKKGSLR